MNEPTDSREARRPRPQEIQILTRSSVLMFHTEQIDCIPAEYRNYRLLAASHVVRKGSKAHTHGMTLTDTRSYADQVEFSSFDARMQYIQDIPIDRAGGATSSYSTVPSNYCRHVPGGFWKHEENVI